MSDDKARILAVVGDAEPWAVLDPEERTLFLDALSTLEAGRVLDAETRDRIGEILSSGRLP